MAKKTNKIDDQFQQVEETLTKTEQFIENNQKNLLRIVTIVVGLIALVFGVQNLYLKPLEKEANVEMYMAEIYFQKDSFNLALEGDGQYLGFLDIADEYGLTNAGELANYYAGICYLNMSDYDNAIEYLSQYSSDDIILSSLALGCIGDAYVELGDLDEGLDYYEDAVNNSDNKFTKPKYMLKAAMIHEHNGDYDKAIDLYKELQLNFKSSPEAAGIERYISRAENR
tara:strand:- start:1043 stop:1723 length:681 start_codon:yes stop_codon:yes gene_type:complete